jgi:hypothetical protein
VSQGVNCIAELMAPIRSSEQFARYGCMGWASRSICAEKGPWTNFFQKNQLDGHPLCQSAQ